MTPAEYYKEGRPSWTENWYEYSILVFVGFLAVMFLYMAWFTDWLNPRRYVNDIMTPVQATFFCVLIGMVSAYGLWRLRSGMEFIKINSTLSIEEKREQIEEAFYEFSIPALPITEDSLEIEHYNRRGLKYQIIVLLSEEAYYVSTQTAQGTDGAAIFDFGYASRLKKKIQLRLEENPEESHEPYV